MSLQENYFNPFFSHIYVEREILNHRRTQEIIAHFPKATLVVIDHYKDVFCRSGQNSILQHQAQSLILAEKKGELIYPGAPVCQSFGNENFYYTSCMMNCVFDCEYCYLKGMYATSHVVVFVNIEDYFSAVEELLKAKAMYLCVSYDTDLLALENVVGYTEMWIAFSKKMQECGYQFKIEVRTKSANVSWLSDAKAQGEWILAITMSPQAVIEQYEHHTASLAGRIHLAKQAMELGIPVRLCFDPMLYCKDWERHYEDMLAQLDEGLLWKELLDVSVGSFRVSQDYLKKMRRLERDSAIVQFPYVNVEGYYQYPERILENMEQYMEQQLSKRVGEEKIFRWK